MGNSVCCLVIFVIFIGLGRGYRLEVDFEVIIWGESMPKRDGTFLWGKLKMGQEKISCNYSRTLSFLVKIILVKLK